MPRSDPVIIELLEQDCREAGLESLYERLLACDPQSALNIRATDKYRIMRALAIAHQTQSKPSELRHSFSKKVPQIRAHWLFNSSDKATLETRIRARVKNHV